MPLDTLEVLRLVSIWRPKSASLSRDRPLRTAQAGRKLDPSVRQLLQRITFHQRLVGLGNGKIALYLQHRMRVAGYRGPLFTSGALRALRRATRDAAPDQRACAKSLLSAFGEGRQVVKFSRVKGAARDAGAPDPQLVVGQKR